MSDKEKKSKDEDVEIKDAEVVSEIDNLLESEDTGVPEARPRVED